LQIVRQAPDNRLNLSHLEEAPPDVVLGEHGEARHLAQATVLPSQVKRSTQCREFAVHRGIGRSFVQPLGDIPA
jgi:hypothetical protein